MFGKRSFYMSVWRWHFFAGLYVVPFLIMLAITGLIMLYAPFLERTQNSDLYYVEQVSDQAMSYEAQYNLVQEAYPDATLLRFYLPADSEEATRFQVSTGEGKIQVFVDPYKGKVLGDLSINDSLYTWADDTHGTFMVGVTGDRLIEVAASFTILLIITGVFLWWPDSSKSKLKAAVKVSKKGGRTFWRDLHSVTGLWVAIVLLFFCISGLAWAGIWGGKLVQAWSTFPMEKRASNLSSTLTHNDLNLKGVKQIPWGLEQAPLPESEAQGPISITLDDVVSEAKSMGFTQFQVHFPKNELGVYTATASTMGKDIKNAWDDRTVHFDRYSGAVLADVGFMDYNWFAKSMAVGIALHMGQFGVWNLIACTLFCLAVILLCISGVVMWWKRRPSNRLTLSAPKMPKDLVRWKHAVWLVLPISLMFPLATVAIIAVILVDNLVGLVAPRVRNFWAS
ncbi:PepSY domain-containing protein [Marinomonas sp. THO17]|uniref:PepSY-associated TM helix domain-containing protein n=1 Tax=Marinomonas sp. THO17 TaxID=3149048 RepID=UPI00336BC3CD